jgi:hypothetical protein
MLEESTDLAGTSILPDVREIPDRLFDDQGEPPLNSSESPSSSIIQLGRLLATCVKAQSLDGIKPGQDPLWRRRVHDPILEIAEVIFPRIGPQKESAVTKVEVL